MVNHLPIKNLTRLNWLMSLMSSLLVVIFLVGMNYQFSDAPLRFLQAFLFVGMTSFWNLLLLTRWYTGLQNLRKLKRITFYLCSYGGTILIWLLVRTLYSLLSGLPWEGEGPHVYMAYVLAVLAAWSFNTLILLVQNVVVLQYRKAQGEIENLQLRANASDTANLLLRQQIHPHFLFNALNTIKSLYKKDFQTGEDYLVHLANFLRVSVSNQTTKTTLVKSELAFCLDYLKMQQIRFGSALNYSVAISGGTIERRYLPFFSLQPLVENALKHNSLTEEEPIMLTITEQNGYIAVSNNLQPRHSREESTGQGLLNLAERYRLLGEEPIQIKSDHAVFTVRIKILDK